VNLNLELVTLDKNIQYEYNNGSVVNPSISGSPQYKKPQQQKSPRNGMGMDMLSQY
jgi:hypothetical protein